MMFLEHTALKDTVSTDISVKVQLPVLQYALCIFILVFDILCT